jgi:hypothetical protein
LIRFADPVAARRRGTVAFLGLAAGFLAAVLGIGGGNVTVPVLATMLRVPLKRAIGTSLAVIVFVAATAVAVEAFAKPTNLLWGSAALVAAGSLVGAPCGAWVLRRIPERPLALLFCAVLLAGAARLAGLLEFAAVPGGGGPGILVAAGLLAGLAASLFGIGGGIVVVPALILAAGAPFHAARATSLVAIVPTTAAAAISHERLGTIERPLVRDLLPGGILGAVIGVLVVNRVPAQTMRIALAVFLAVVALRLARSALRAPR